MVPQENGILKKSFVGVDEILSNRTKIVGTVKFNADDSQKLHTTILRLVNEQSTEENTVRDKPEMKILGPNLQNKHVLINFQLRRQLNRESTGFASLARGLYNKCKPFRIQHVHTKPVTFSG